MLKIEFLEVAYIKRVYLRYVYAESSVRDGSGALFYFIFRAWAVAASRK
jgi:hypothetical protein